MEMIASSQVSKRPMPSNGSKSKEISGSCLLFTLGNLETVSASPTGYFIIEVYYEATKSKAGINAIIWISSEKSNVNNAFDPHQILLLTNNPSP